MGPGLRSFGRQIEQEVGSLLRLAGGSQNSFRVALEDLEPGSDVVSMVGPWLEAQPQVRSEEGCTEFSDQFFEGVGAAAEAPIQSAVEAMLGSGPMNQLMRQDSVVAFKVTKLCMLRQPDLIDSRCVIGPVAAVTDLDAGPADELGGSGQGLGLVEKTFRLGLGAVDLVFVENEVTSSNDAAWAGTSVLIVIST